MRKSTLLVAVCLTLAAVAASLIVPAAHAQNQPTTRVVITASREWTNDDVDQLRREAPVSFFSSAEGAPETQVAQAAALSPTPRPIRVLDPDWYADQSAQLQAELENRQGTLQQYIQNIQDARSRANMTSGIALDKGSIGVTPEGGIEVLQARIGEIQSKLDDLTELARKSGILPGALRG